MDPILHDNKKSDLYISEPYQERLADLEDNIPKAPPSDEVLMAATASVPEMPQYEGGVIPNTAVDPYLDTPPGQVVTVQYPEDAYQNQMQPIQKTRDWFLISTAMIAFLLLIGFVVQLVLAATQTHVVAAKSLYEKCKEGGGALTPISSTLIQCSKDNTIYTAAISHDAASTLEEQYAKTGRVSFETAQMAKMDKEVVSNTQGITQLGIVAYSDPAQDTFSQVVVNNTFLQADQAYNNDVSLKKVQTFLDKSVEFTSTELLGKESLLLRAFQNSALAPQSKAIQEIAVQVGSFEQNRGVWGVDGNAEGMFTVKGRVFGKIRNNYIMIETSLPYTKQQNLLKTTLKDCQQKFRSNADIQNCYTDALKSNQEVVKDVEAALKQAVERFGL